MKVYSILYLWLVYATYIGVSWSTMPVISHLIRDKEKNTTKGGLFIVNMEALVQLLYM